MRRGLALSAVVVTLVGAAATPQATADQSPPPTTKSVTLISGDRVLVQGEEITIIPGPGRDDQVFRRAIKNGHITVTPQDAVPLIQQGKLDKRLFDVTTLINQHRDDASRDTVPLIVENRGRSSISKRSPRWDEIKRTTGKIWLDGEKKLVDAESHAQIGAPQAWQRGLTGKGVTVAVLDGGYDPTHPDLQGKVVEAKDFTQRGVKDTYGHGTHVAGTIAGQGSYGGTAPDAKLLIGKVCGDETCEDSAILEAMEWAAPKAKIVNLSLGGEATDGTDPISLAVNRLTEQYGTLFVIAAGNEGGAMTVGTPAAADAALAVGSVSKKDALSRFSSRGPRVNDMAVKPEIVAPGEAIGAARAKDTSMGTPINDLYTRASGTSMATPHVAGAAAVLAQQHPEWRAPQLKAALMSSAKDVGKNVYEEGSGRLDLDKATTQATYASPGALNFGVLKFPHTSLPPIIKTLTYHNDGDQPVTYQLKADHEAISFSANEITVQPHNQQQAQVTLEPNKVKVGIGSARITAGPNTTAVGFTAEPEQYELTINTIDRQGKPVGASLSIFSLDNDEDVDLPPPVDGVTKVRLLKGRYAVNALISEDVENTWASTPAIMVDRPVTTTIDARQGREIGATTEKPLSRKYIQIDAVHRNANQRSQDGVSSKKADTFFAVPVKADPAYFNFGVHQVLSTTNKEYYVATPTAGAIPEELSPKIRERDMGAENVRYRAQGSPEIGSRSSTPFYVPGQFAAFGVPLDLRIPARRTEFFSAGKDIRFTFHFFQRPPDQAQVGFDGHLGRDTHGFTPGERLTTSWNSAVVGTDLDLRGFHGLMRQGNSGYVQHWPFAPGESDASDEFVFGAPYVTANTKLSTEDGKVLGESENVFAFFTMPEQAQRYVLDVAAKRSPKWTPFAPSVRTRWTFTSAKTAAKEYLAVPTLHVTGTFDDYNRAPACGVFPLKISVTPQKGSVNAAAVKKVTAEMSTDDGATWRAMPVIGKGSAWHAFAVHERQEFVSLRIKAVDAAGNEVEQTTIRAYGLTR
ncbi:serine protease [Lentzea sp. NBRC 105346]|uniref:S8 family peptidase n=1 Tax=Lentzea sp. NBRC 105346 TaxID=3032205 RepID=UPI0024A3355B|nr:S8 family serine peptidase [Lentzea sp. NBRC 105346]GLZ29467.1 serine protease [Lentzea sp. NBRC 105346]